MDNGTRETDLYALDCIRIRVRRLVGQKLIHYDEYDDVCNTIYCEFLKRRHRFDPARGSYSTFTSCVVRNLVASLASTRSEFRRRHTFTEYSDAALLCGFHGPHFSRSTVDVLDLQISVRRAVNTLPDRLRWLANAMCSQTLTEISETTDKPRSSLYEQRAEIRSHFERLGIGIGDWK